MNRFMPDTWREALMRPIAMAAPDANVYVEIMAPDFRFAFVAVLLSIWVVLGWRKKWQLSPTLILLAFISVSFVPWLATTGNGRYFIPMLLSVGPLCIALIYWLPWTRPMKGAIAVLLISIQSFAVYESTPWRSWTLGTWSREPFFELTADQDLLIEPSTFVTITSISYSLIAPKFHESSRWVNLSGVPVDRASMESRRVQAMLSASPSLKLIVPSMPAHMTQQGLPNDDIAKVIDRMLAPQRLALASPASCRFLRSRGLATVAFRKLDKINPETVAKFGFWICQLTYSVDLPAADPAEFNPLVNRVFERVENACPNIFPPGQTKSSRTEGGVLRDYPSADMKTYVLDGGEVVYKYWKALNPILIGTVDEVLGKGFKMDCNNIRGRSGLPWERRL